MDILQQFKFNNKFWPISFLTCQDKAIKIAYIRIAEVNIENAFDDI